MMARTRFPLLGSLLLALLAMLSPAGTRPLAAAAPLVRDDAHLFDPATIKQVDLIVKQIHEKFGKDLTIRSFATIPESLRASFTAESKDVFYEHWLRHEAQAAETNGVFILILKEPGHLQIGVGKTTMPKAFTYADRDELRELMVKAFHAEKFDEGLIEGAHFVLERMEKNGAELHGATPVDSPADAPILPQTQPAAILVPTTAPAIEPAATAPTTRPSTDAPTIRPAGDAPTTRPSTDVPTTKAIPAESGVKPAAPNSVELNK